MIDAPPVCGTLSDGARMGGGLTGRTHTRAESCPCVARTLTQRMHKGFDSTLDSQTPIVTQGGVFDGEPTCFHPTQDPICSSDGSAHAMGTGSKGGCSSHAVCVTGQRTHALTTRVAACEEDGTGRGTPITPAVAFKPSYFTRGKDGAPAEVVAPLSADADKGDQDTVIATPIDMRQASRGEKVTNNRSQGSGGPPGHGVGGAGDPAFTVSERGQAVAFTKAKRAQSATDDESWVPGEVAPTQNQFDQGDTRATTVEPVRSTSEMQRVHQAQPMCVRRLTATECEFLQGFPPDYTLVTYRKKPAADGPRYRALGNSMAVPCMWWLGKRIHEATQCD